MTGKQAKWSMVIWTVLMMMGAYQLGDVTVRHAWWREKGLPDTGYHMSLAVPLTWLIYGALHLAWHWHRITVDPPERGLRQPSRWLMMAGMAAVGGGLWFWGRGTDWTHAQAAIYPGLGCAVAGVIMDRIGK